MDWSSLPVFLAYGGLGLASLIIWWVIYDKALTPGLPLRDALFGKTPNVSVAVDLIGGFFALGILNYAIITSPPLESFLMDIEAAALTLLGTIILLGVIRMGIASFLRIWFRDQRDAQGDIITVNNELFRQHNLATGFFSTALYLILVAGLIEEDLLNIEGYRAEATYNMIGVWLLGLAVVLLHSLFYLGVGPSNHILHESFHDNNPAAPFSLLGLLSGVLLLNHSLLLDFQTGQHMFNQGGLWLFLLAAIATVLMIRGVLQLILFLRWRINLRYELVIRDNPAWGVMDGGLIFVLFLILLGIVQ